LWKKAETDISSETFKSLKEYYEKNGAGLSDLRSITIGVNLSAALEPKEAGIISFNSEFSAPVTFSTAF
jgi:hypothetical protein